MRPAVGRGVASALTGGCSAAPALRLSRAMNPNVLRHETPPAAAWSRALPVHGAVAVSIVGTSHDPTTVVYAPHGTTGVAAPRRDAQLASRAGLTRGTVRRALRLLPMVSASGVGGCSKSAADRTRRASRLVSRFSVRYTTRRHTAAVPRSAGPGQPRATGAARA
jgi:hypothetical protein